jgi:hypothetical protein
MILLVRQLLVRKPRRRRALSSTRDPFFADPVAVEDDYRRMRRD